MNTTALTISEIKEMETIHIGQYDDLKYEDERTRVWLSRVERNRADIESFDGDKWIITKTITEG